MATERRVVTPADLAESLEHIGRWVEAVRKVVAQLPPNAQVVIDQPRNGGPWIDYGDCTPFIKKIPGQP